MGKHSEHNAARTLTHRGAMRALGAAVLAVGGAAALASAPASAATTLDLGTGAYLIHVPAGPVTVSFHLVAAGGGASGDGSHEGGFGGVVDGSFTWTGPAAKFSLTVGRQGFAGGPAGPTNRNGGRGGGNGTEATNGYLRGHGGNGGGGAKLGNASFAPGGGGGGGASVLIVNNVTVLVAGAGGGGSQFEAGVNGYGSGTTRWLAPGGVGKPGQGGQVGGGGGGGGAINGVGAGSGLGGGGGTGYAGGIAHLTFTVTGTGRTGDETYGLPGTDGRATLTGDGIFVTQVVG